MQSIVFLTIKSGDYVKGRIRLLAQDLERLVALTQFVANFSRFLVIFLFNGRLQQVI